MHPFTPQGQFSFEYLPLKVQEQTSKLELYCAELGNFLYELQLKATPAAPEKALKLQASLGTTDVKQATFTNYSRQKTDYACRVDNGEFHCEKTVSAAPGWPAGTPVSMELSYEPSTLGEARGTLHVTSALGGEYVFPLFGSCTAPRPQGPFGVKAGGSTTISFRNVFAQTTTFVCQVRHPSHTLLFPRPSLTLSLCSLFPLTSSLLHPSTLFSLRIKYPLLSQSLLWYQGHTSLTSYSTTHSTIVPIYHSENLYYRMGSITLPPGQLLHFL